MERQFENRNLKLENCDIPPKKFFFPENRILNNVGYSGSYWSSTVDDDGSCCFNMSPYFSSSTSYVQPTQTYDRAYAMSVRCVKE